MPVDKAFLDTNVLVYAFSAGDSKKEVADRLMISGGTIGIQTLNEFINVQRGKLRKTWPVVLQRLQIIETLCPPPIPLTVSIHNRGLSIAMDHGYHIYDSFMLAAALEASCTIFYTEDMRDGQLIGDLRIRNPFATP